MNLKLTTRKISQATLAIAVGVCLIPDSSQARTVSINQENSKINQPTLIVNSDSQVAVITQESSESVTVAVDSQNQLKTESVSIPVKVDNQATLTPINIPVVPAVTEQVIQQQTEVNPVVTLENVERTLISQQVKTINSSAKNGKQQSNPDEELVSSVPIQIEYYDPTTSPSVEENIISPQVPNIISPEPYLPEESNTFKGYVWPAKGVFTSGYGWRWGRMHKGIDIAAPIGTPIIAAADGQVISSGWNSGGYGNLVKIKHFDGSISFYAHNSKNLVRRGEWVKQGQQIAKMGSTGFSTGPHLHFEIRNPAGKALNPVSLLPKKR